MKEFTTSDIVKNATDEQLEKIFSLSVELSRIIGNICEDEAQMIQYITRMAYCPDYCKVDLISLAALGELSDRAKSKNK